MSMLYYIAAIYRHNQNLTISCRFPAYHSSFRTNYSIVLRKVFPHSLLMGTVRCLFEALGNVLPGSRHVEAVSRNSMDTKF